MSQTHDQDEALDDASFTRPRSLTSRELHGTSVDNPPCATDLPVPDGPDGPTWLTDDHRGPAWAAGDHPYGAVRHASSCDQAGTRAVVGPRRRKIERVLQKRDHTIATLEIRTCSCGALDRIVRRVDPAPEELRPTVPGGGISSDHVQLREVPAR